MPCPGLDPADLRGADAAAPGGGTLVRGKRAEFHHRHRDHRVPGRPASDPEAQDQLYGGPGRLRDRGPGLDRHLPAGSPALCPLRQHPPLCGRGV